MSSTPRVNCNLLNTTDWAGTGRKTYTYSDGEAWDCRTDATMTTNDNGETELRLYNPNEWWGGCESVTELVEFNTCIPNADDSEASVSLTIPGQVVNSLATLYSNGTLALYDTTYEFGVLTQYWLTLTSGAEAAPENNLALTLAILEIALPALAVAALCCIFTCFYLRNLANRSDSSVAHRRRINSHHQSGLCESLLNNNNRAPTAVAITAEEGESISNAAPYAPPTDPNTRAVTEGVNNEQGEESLKV